MGVGVWKMGGFSYIHDNQLLQNLSGRSRGLV
jgi:hypothetical protein